MVATEQASTPSVVILLGNGKNAIVDESDFSRANKHKWTAHWIHNNWYAVRTEEKRTIYLHRFLTGAGTTEKVDHKNGDGLDCRQINLRVCTHRQNCYNRRPKAGFVYKGITFRKKGKERPWQARIRSNGKQISLGYYPTAEDAARAYDAAARRYQGEFAWLNFK